MNTEKEKELPVITYILYDKKTGKIVNIHRSYDVENDQYSECNLEDLKDRMVEDEFLMSRVTDRNAKNVDVLMTTEMPEGIRKHYRNQKIDLKSRKLIEKPKIVLLTRKKELIGDGKDKTEIEIKVVDQEGKVVENYSGTIKVVASRGKLPSKGGLIQVNKGRGSISLQSVNETVPCVMVRAECIDERCQESALDLEFI